MVIVKNHKNFSTKSMNSLNKLDVSQFNKCLGGIVKNKKSEHIKFLKKQRFILLEAIHEMQKKLDCVDYVIYLLKRINANERDKEEVKMTIGEISQEIGLSADTLRYYEKIGLLPNVPRDNSGKRNYDENFINWIKFIQTLKNSGMSLNDIIEYINLAKCGLLIKSKQILLEKMLNLQSMIEKANYQINNYDNILVPKTNALIF